MIKEEVYQPIPVNRSLLVLETPIKEQRSEKYEQLKRIILDIGEWNVNVSMIAKEWSMPRSTLQNWKENIVAKKGVIDIFKVGSRIQENMVSNINLLQKTVHGASSVHEKKQAINAYNETVDTFTRFLEAYGYKEKVADKLDINQKVVSVIFSSPNDKYPDIEAEKRRRKDNLQTNK